MCNKIEKKNSIIFLTQPFIFKVAHSQWFSPFAVSTLYNNKKQINSCLPVKTNASSVVYSFLIISSFNSVTQLSLIYFNFPIQYTHTHIYVYVYGYIYVYRIAWELKKQARTLFPLEEIYIHTLSYIHIFIHLAFVFVCLLFSKFFLAAYLHPPSLVFF